MDPQGKRKREEGEEEEGTTPNKKPTTTGTVKTTTIVAASAPSTGTKKVISTVVASKPAAKTTVITSAPPQPSVSIPAASPSTFYPPRYPSSVSSSNLDDEDAAPLPVFSDGSAYGRGTTYAPASTSSSYTPSPTITSFGSSFNRPSSAPSGSFYQTSSTVAATATATAAAAAVAAASKKADGSKTIKRAAAGEEWEDTTLLDWPDNDFRIFVGDLGPEVNDEVLKQAFIRYSSFQKAKVIRDKRTGKTKGFGFVSFLNPLDFAQALREMNGKYIGNRPVKLRKSRWQDRNKE